MAVQKLSELKLVYLIHGPEKYLLDRAVSRLKSLLSASADLDFNFDIFNGESADPHEIVEKANTLPFMSERRLVLLRNADKMPTSGLNVLADYAKNPNPETTLVLVAAKIAKNMRIYKAIDALGGAWEFKKPQKSAYPQKVVEMFDQRGRQIGIDETEILVRAVGYDLQRLSVEVDKVIAHAGDATTLTRKDVEEVMSTTAPTSIFDFLDAIGARDARTALRLLADLLGEGESIYGIHAMSVRHVRNLLGTRALMSRPGGKQSPEAIAKQVGLIPWQARNIMRQAKRFSAEELVDALRGAAKGEAHMKTSQDARLVFERWLISVCG